jgi:hypothetical protein
MMMNRRTVSATLLASATSFLVLQTGSVGIIFDGDEGRLSEAAFLSIQHVRRAGG